MIIILLVKIHKMYKNKKKMIKKYCQQMLLQLLIKCKHVFITGFENTIKD